MSRYAKPMSQTLAEMKMNDPKLLKIFDKLKPKDTIQLKVSSAISKGKGLQPYTVRSKNTLRNGVEKITMILQGNPTGVKRFLYKKDGKVTFAIGDMAASIDDIKENLEEGYESEVLKVLDDAGIDGYFRNGKLYVDKRDAKAAKGALEDADNIIKLPKMVKEEVELEEMKMTHVLINMQGKVQGYTSNEKDAKEMARRTKSTIHPIKKPITDKTLEKMNALQKTPKELQDLGLIEAIDPADVDDDATDADKKAADKNMIMQMRKAMDVKGNMKIEFGDGKKEKVDPKILQMMVTAHGKIQKPRDKEKFVAMISKSKRDMLMVAKKLSTLKMDLDKEDEPIVKKVVQMLKKASKAHAGQADDLDKAIKETLDIQEGTWKMPDNPKEVAALKKLMSRPLPIGNTEDEKMYKDSASSKLYSLLGDDELFDALGALEDKGKEKADARPVIIKWFQQRAKNNRYDLGDETKELGKQIGLKMEYVPESIQEKPAEYLRLQMANSREVNLAMKWMRKNLPQNNQGFDGGPFASSLDIEFEGVDDAEKLIKTLKKAGFSFKVDHREMNENIDEGKMKQFHMMMDDGKSAEEIAKALKLDLKTVKALMKESLDEKYDLYHKTFSDAMQHAYDYAKKKLGITVDPKEIDNKVATGPKKPSEGKTNKYRLKGKGGNLQIQVYNKGGSKPFELNMYKEENEMSDKLTGGNLSLKETVMKMWQEAKSPEQQAAIAISKKEKEKEEGNAFGAALKAARDNGDDTFMVSGKKYKVEDYKDTKEKKLDPVGKEDGDIDNDGDKDATDKYLAKRRKAISKAIKKDKKESFERYHETKQGSLRDAVLQMWGENIKEKKDLTKEKKDGIKKMTDTGKEVTPVEMSPKMPKVKESKNKV